VASPFGATETAVIEADAGEGSTAAAICDLIMSRSEILVIKCKRLVTVGVSGGWIVSSGGRLVILQDCGSTKGVRGGRGAYGSGCRVGRGEPG
jgi:hypothetical protein